MFDFLNIDNDKFMDLSQSQIESFLNKAQMPEKTKASVQKEYISSNKVIDNAKFCSENGAVFVWVKLTDTDALSKSEIISVARMYFRIIKSDFVLIELEYKGLKKYSACRKHLAETGIDVNTEILCNFSPWIYEKNNGTPVYELLKKIKKIVESDEELKIKNNLILDAINDFSEWADINLLTIKNKILKELGVASNLNLFTITKKSHYESDRFVEPNTLFHVLLENKLKYSEENEWDAFIGRISSYLQRAFTEEDFYNYYRFKTGGNYSEQFTESLLDDYSKEIKRHFSNLIDEENCATYKYFYAVLGSTELCEGMNTEYTYEKVFEILDELWQENSSEKEKLSKVEKELSGSLLRKAIQTHNDKYFELSEKLCEKDHDERCHYGIKTKNIEIIEEELKFGIEEYFIDAVLELARYYVNELKGAKIIDRAENLLKYIELLNLARLKGNDDTISKVAYKGSNFFTLVSFNADGNVYLERIVYLIENNFKDAPSTYHEYLAEIEKFQTKQQQIAEESKRQAEESKRQKEEEQRNKEEAEKSAIDNDIKILPELKAKKQELEKQISDIEVQLENISTHKEFEIIDTKLNLLKEELNQICERIHKASK